ncbi:ABC transporter ATP-binding protein [Bdellovibrionota bacterium FG-1]
MADVVEISNVDRVFRSGFWLRRTQVLHQVSLAVPQQSVFGLVGANGAGKTTLIQLIVGIRKPTRGSVLIGGLPAWTLQARARVGYLPERPYFYDHLRGEDFLRFFGALSGLTRAQVRDRIPQVLAAVGMTEARKIELKKYSKGMLQRIGIAQAILHDPALLVLDEPMSGLDPVGRKEIRELIIALAAQGRTVFFSSHVISDVEAICDRVALIRKGQVVRTGPVQALLPEHEPKVELGLGNVSVERVAALSGMEAVRAMPDGVRALAQGQSAVDRALEVLVPGGARVLWVTPVRPSLEDLL